MAMQRPDRSQGVAARLIDTYKGELTSLSLWVTGVWFFGMAYAVTGDRSIRDDEVVAFTAAFALAAAAATVTALAVASRGRWALGAAVCFSAFATIAAGVAIWISWLAGPPARTLRRLMSVWRVSEAAIVAGLFLGVGIGLIAGLSILLARRWPWLVGWLASGILVACVARYAHITAFDHVANYIIKARLGREASQGRLFYPAYRVELASAIGAGAGAVVGAAAVCAVLWWVGRRRTADGSGQPRLAPGDPSPARSIVS
jgi:hypothetical protein